MAITAGTTAVRVIHRVHGLASDGRTNTAPARGTRFTDLAQAMLFVADLADRGAALNVNLADFTRAQTHLSVAALASEQAGRAPAERATCAPLPG